MLAELSWRTDCSIPGFHGTILSNIRQRRNCIRKYLSPHTRPSRQSLYFSLYRYCDIFAKLSYPSLIRTLLVAGKDRTGVVAALLLRVSPPVCFQCHILTRLQLAGVDDDTIAEDYALTRVGREPVRPMIMARLAKVPLFASNHEKALNMLTSR